MQFTSQRIRQLAGKAARIGVSVKYVNAALRCRVAAAIEHAVVLRHTNPLTIVDVGANKGQFSLVARKECPAADIYAFEPLSEPGSRFNKLFEGDERVILSSTAISDIEETAIFYVTDRDDSSSLLKPSDKQATAFDVREARRISIETAPLENFVDITSTPRPRLLKIDVQGAELKVLRGCSKLEEFDYVYVELSYVKLYEGQPLFSEVAEHLFSKNFELAGTFNQTVTKAFGPTQADFLFCNKINLTQLA